MKFRSHNSPILPLLHKPAQTLLLALCPPNSD
jgi:hypothetical protein